MVRSVIFDLDGTLLDTLEDIRVVVNRVMDARGHQRSSTEEVRLAVGMGVETLSMKLLPPGTAEKEVLEAAEDIRRVYLELGSVLTKPYPGIREMLETVDSSGLPMAVLTNKPQASAEEAIMRFFPSVNFRMVRGVMKGRPIKPSPEAVIDVLAALGAPPGETAMVGDSDVDMRTAIAAGLIPVGVSWGFRERELLIAHGASVIADSPLELTVLLSSPQG